MNTQQLKQKILDLAIRGQLVPQDSNDEPASVLLEKIRAEKQALIEQKKIKKDKKSSYITCEKSPYRKEAMGNDKWLMGNDQLGRIYTEYFSDGTTKDITQEIPFEIPENWAWCRLGEIGRTVQYGVSKSAKSEGLYKLLRITDIQENKVVWENVPFTDIEKEEAESFVLKNGDFLFARTGATVGKSYLVENLMQKSVFASYLIRISLLPNNNINYIKYFFNSEYYWQQISEKSVGIGQPNVNGTSLKELFLPLPPLSEQQRIVAKVEELLALVEDLETNKTDLKSYIQQTKAKVLDMAIRGELVPQNPDDEPASVLLERIKNEQATTKPKSKKTTHNTHYDNDKWLMVNEEMPFDIPKNWAWCRLGEVCEKIETGNSINAQTKEKRYKNLKEGYPYIGTKDVNENNDIEYDNGVKIPFEEKFKIAEKQSVLLCIEGGSAGRKIGITDRNVCYGNKLAKFYSQNVSTFYIFYFLMSAEFKAQFKESLAGLIGGVGVNKLSNFSIPLPPLSEQKRIVQKIEKIFSELNAIEENLT